MTSNNVFRNNINKILPGHGWVRLAQGWRDGNPEEFTAVSKYAQLLVASASLGNQGKLQLCIVVRDPKVGPELIIVNGYDGGFFSKDSRIHILTRDGQKIVSSEEYAELIGSVKDNTGDYTGWAGTIDITQPSATGAPSAGP